MEVQRRGGGGRENRTFQRRSLGFEDGGLGFKVQRVWGLGVWGLGLGSEWRIEMGCPGYCVGSCLLVASRPWVAGSIVLIIVTRLGVRTKYSGFQDVWVRRASVGRWVLRLQGSACSCLCSESRGAYVI